MNLRLANRRLVSVAAIALPAAALLVAALFWASRPRQVANFLVARIAATLDLEITVAARAEYQLRGTPRLVLRDVVARRHGDVPLLRADRIDVSLPWSTLRGSELTIRRVELDRPRLDLAALRRWLATRPPSEQRMPTLTDGLRIRDGSISNDDWRVDEIGVDLPSLRPGRPLRAHLHGRYSDASTVIRFDLAVALARPDKDAGLGVAGALAVEHGDWRLPAQVSLSGPLHLGEDDLRIVPARIAVAARYVSGDTALPFALGLHGPLRFGEAAWSFAPVGVAVRGEGVVPAFDARGALALGRRLVLRLQGRLFAWPKAWPALPPPLGASSSPLPFVVDYAGNASLADEASLRIARDAASFDGRFHLPEVLAWLDAREDSPIPPLRGQLRAASLEVAGAQLEGVRVHVDAEESSTP